MWIKSSGLLGENVYQLTTPVSSHLLVYNGEAALIDTSISAVQGRLIEEIAGVVSQTSELSYVFVTHTHFDHIGGIPYLRTFSPKVKLVVSPQCAEMLEDQSMLEQAYEQNEKAAEAMKQEMQISEKDWCSSFGVEQILGDGDSIKLGDEVEIKLIATPGHTEDSVSYLIRPDDALVVGEALGGYHGRDRITSCFTSSYQDYLNSIDKLSKLNTSIIQLPHDGALTGDLAKKHIIEARAEAERMQALVKAELDQGKLVEEIFDDLFPEWQEQNYSPDGPFMDVQQEALKNMIAIVAADR